MDADRTELLVRLLARHQAELFRFIFALLPHGEDARDVFQETSVALCRKFTDYDPDKPFLAWAFGFAHLEVLKHHERTQRSNRFLNLELIEILARERQTLEPVLEARLQALDQCLKGLSSEDQELIRKRYRGSIKVDDLVRQFGTSRRSLFRKLDRIRRTLFECINRRLAATT